MLKNKKMWLAAVLSAMMLVIAACNNVTGVAQVVTGNDGGTSETVSEESSTEADSAVTSETESDVASG